MDRHLVRWFYRLAQAYERFETLDASQSIIFCAEKLNGQRRFGVSKLTDFWKAYTKLAPELRHIYEVIRQNTPCRLYLDLEFHTDVNPGISGTDVVAIVIELAIKTIFRTFNFLCSTEDVLTLDSSSEEKFSQHLIFNIPNVLFKDNHVIGRFMRTMIAEVREVVTLQMATCNGVALERLAQLFVNSRDGHKICIVDLNVYNRSQQFRMWKSSKISTGVVLEIAQENKFFLFDEADIFTFQSTLVITRSTADTRLLDFDALRVEPTMHRRVIRNHLTTTSRFTQLDAFVLNIIRQQQNRDVGIKVKELQHQGDVQLFVYHIHGSSFCLKVNREHRSNRVYYIANLVNGILYQMCWKCWGYRGNPVPIPRESYFTMSEEASLNKEFAKSIDIEGVKKNIEVIELLD